MSAGTRILVVDDDEQVLLATSRMLRSAGYEVFEAASGGECMERLKAERPDLVLLDVVLGDHDGVDICRRIKEELGSARVFVILVSGRRTSSASQTYGLDAGADGYIVRPLPRQDFLARIESMVRIQHAEARLHHLNAVLRGIRNVNQLITKETDRDRLLAGACANLTESMGYDTAWIAQLDENGRAVRVVQSGVGPEFEVLEKRLRAGELPACARRAMTQSGTVVVSDLATQCPDCPLRDKDTGQGVLTTQLTSSGKVFGVMAVSMSPRFVDEREMLSLSEEVAQDIAFALRGLDLEDEKREANAHMRQLAAAVESAADGIGMSDEHGRVKYMNPALRQQFGYSVEELNALGGSPGICVDPTAGEQIVKAIAEGGSWVGDIQTRSRDGQVFETSVRASAVKNEAGQIEGFIGIHRDMTERKRAENELRESEQRYRGIFEATTDAVLIFDPHGRIVSANPRAYQMYGYEPGEMIGLSGADIVTPGYHYLFKRFREDIAAGREFHAESVDRRKDGSTFDIEVKGTKFLHEGEPRLLAIIRDITERKAQERALRESELRYRTLAENFPKGALFLYDRDVRYIWADGRGLEQVGLHRDQLIGRTMYEVFPPNVCQDAEEACRGVFGGRAATYETNFADQWYRGLAVPVYGPQGRINEGLAIVFEITEERMREQELAQHREHLEELVEDRTRELEESRAHLRRAERLASIGTLAAGIAHEINNPVGGMLLTAEHLLAGENLTAEMRECLDDIIRNANRCKAIIQNVRRFARSEQTEKVRTDLGPVIQRAVTGTRDYARRSGAWIEIFPGDKLPEVMMNPIGVEQVVINLVRNAIEALAKNIAVRTQHSNDMVQILIEDDGRGIDPEEAEFLFDPFYTTRQCRGGMGLGLSITHGIISDHGGRIDVARRPEGGTRFVVSLPLHCAGR